MKSRAKQDGAALVYTLILLAIMVTAALSSIQLSSLEQRMSASYRTNQAAFITAETALLEAERCVKNRSVCNDLASFDANCSNGLCFTGTHKNNVQTCRPGRGSWNDATLWADATKIIEAVTLPDPSSSAYYVIEFICYVPVGLFGVAPDPTNPNDWSKLYRITVTARAGDANSVVMLQSTYKL